MSDNPEWFAAKRYGFGSGAPIAWQGWVILIAYLIIVLGSAAMFSNRPLVLMSIVAPVTALLILITARTTRGGWRWRWGGED
ncbi:MAG: hypothetical protein ACJ8EY_08555 [Sphingomicrobium sp.]